jgi:signal peptidase I
MQGEIDYFTIAAVLAAISALYIGYCFVTRGNAERDLKRRGILEVAWPLAFICSLGLLLAVTEFSAVLLLAALITGIIWGWDHWLVRPKRAAGVPEPVVVDMARAFFPVVVVVFFIRSFWLEPFKIPSGSMKPTLLIGDFILVNKYIYGIRLPVLNRKLTEGTPVARGDVIVFRYPLNPQQDYIKRVIGLPGDRVSYSRKRLSINGVEVPTQPSALVNEGGQVYQTFLEKVGEKSHTAQFRPDRQGGSLAVESLQFPNRRNCEYNGDGFSCVVPAGHYFGMGDNRDDSADSRIWGFIPDDHLKGRAFLVWMNFSALRRIGNSIE